MVSTIKLAASLTVLSVSTLMQLGCSPPVTQEFATATGLVNAAGKPLTGAVVTLEPTGSTKGANTSVSVLGGRFEVTPESKLIGGTYLVRLSMIPSELRSAIPAEAGYVLPPDEAVIDPRFDTNSQLTWTIVPGQINEKQFDIEFLKP